MYNEPVKFTHVDQYGNDREGEDDVYTVECFRSLCAVHQFIDYDGHGHPVRDSKADPTIFIKPSRLYEIPTDATHIVWYNR